MSNMFDEFDNNGWGNNYNNNGYGYNPCGWKVDFWWLFLFMQRSHCNIFMFFKGYFKNQACY
jgi:hypothetical protein